MLGANNDEEHQVEPMEPLLYPSPYTAMRGFGPLGSTDSLCSTPLLLRNRSAIGKFIAITYKLEAYSLNL